MRLYKLKALLKLGLEDLTKNMSVFVYVLIPLAFALLYSNMFDIASDAKYQGYLYSTCVLMNISMIPVTLMGTIIAEEKEKNTLRTLMLNDVKAIEIMIAKALICILFVVIDNIIMYFIVGLAMDKFVLYQLVGLLVGLAVILFGGFVGVFAKNQMSASLLSIPFMIIFLAPMFIQILQNEVALKISALLPTDAMMTLFNSITNSTMNWSDVGMPLVVIAAWMILSIVMFHIAFKKMGVDN